MGYAEIDCKRYLKMVEKAIKKAECIVQMYKPLKVRKLNFNELEGAEVAFRCTCRLVYLATYIPQGVSF